VGRGVIRRDKKFRHLWQRRVTGRGSLDLKNGEGIDELIDLLTVISQRLVAIEATGGF
jgi:hypothetical protein